MLLGNIHRGLVDAGIAASGSVVLAHGEGRPRSPANTHAVLLPSERLAHSLSDVLGDTGSDDTSNMVIAADLVAPET